MSTNPIINLWRRVSYIGLQKDGRKEEFRFIIINNQIWFIFVILSSLSLPFSLFGGNFYGAGLTLLFLAIYMSVPMLMFLRLSVLSRLVHITIHLIAIFFCAIYFGQDSRMIEFLFATLILPFLLFDVKRIGIIATCSALTIALYFTYYNSQAYFASYALSRYYQYGIFYFTMPIKFVSILGILYLTFNRIKESDDEINEQRDKLTTLKEYYEEILHKIPIEIVVFDKQMRYKFVNQFSVKDDNVRDWIIGKTDREYFAMRNLNPDVGEERVQRIQEAIVSKQVIEWEELFTDRNGNTFVKYKVITPVLDENQELKSLLAYSLDISKIKESEKLIKNYAEELERSNQELKQFAYVSSHDLKSPLRNITNYLQLLERHCKDKIDAEDMELLTAANYSARHLNQLIGDLLLYTTTDQRDKPLEEVSLNKIIQNVVSGIQHTIEERRVQLEIEEHLPVVKGHAATLNILFSNLIENGIKYNHSNPPTIKISAVEHKDFYEVHVRDNGIGINEAYLNSIFIIFKRLHISEEYEGTGIGLAICKKIIESNGGKIWVTSTEGVGSTFSFTFPKY
jgi:signal transduction histidine kinase